MVRGRSLRTRFSIVRIAAVPFAAVLLMTGSVMPASAATKGNSNPNNYLALDDSIPFGFNPFLVRPGVDPNTFVGYPELASSRFRPMKKLANAGCPGETTGSFIDVNVPNNGCESYRAIAALHVSYSGSQLASAENYVGARPRTGLISITLGANDAGPLLLYCSAHTSNLDELAACVARGLHRPSPDAAIGNVLPKMAANLTTIYSSLIDAGFHGEFVAVTYYSTNYADVFPTNFLAAVDQVLAAVTKQFGGKVADAFAAFQAASAPFGSDACAAGLLIPHPPGRGPPGSCNMHPSRAGAELLAQTLRAAA